MGKSVRVFVVVTQVEGHYWDVVWVGGLLVKQELVSQIRELS